VLGIRQVAEDDSPGAFTAKEAFGTLLIERVTSGTINQYLWVGNIR